MKPVVSLAIVLMLSAGLAVSQTRTKQRVKARNEARFLYAIEKGDVVIFYKLLRRGVNVNARRDNRPTALMIAAHRGSASDDASKMNRPAIGTERAVK